MKRYHAQRVGITSALLLGVAGATSGARGQCAPQWLPGIPGMNGTVSAMAVLPDGHVLVGGAFTTAGGAPANYLARFDPSGNTWSALGSEPNGEIRTLALLPDGDLIVGGFFTAAGGVPANHIARYSPSTDTWSALGAGVEGYFVRALAVLPNGDVVVGGGFSMAGGMPANNIALYSTATNTWSALGAGTSGGPHNGTVYALAVLPGGDVLVGGEFTSADGMPASMIARYSPASATWSTLGSGTNGWVLALAVLAGGDVIVGGYFTSAGGESAIHIARYSPADSTWSPIGAGVSGPGSGVFTLTLLPVGDVIAGGSFSNAGGVPASNIARLNPANNTWSALGSGTNGWVFQLTAIPGGDVLVGGGFSTAGGNASSYFGRWGPAWGDLNGDGFVRLADWSLFVGCIHGPESASGAGCGCADADSDGDVDLQDAAVFQLRFRP